MVTKVLCVAEKPSIAKAVANHLSGNQITTVSTNSSHEQDGTLTQVSETSKAISTSRTTALSTTSLTGGNAT